LNEKISKSNQIKSLYRP